LGHGIQRGQAHRIRKAAQAQVQSRTPRVMSDSLRATRFLRDGQHLRVIWDRGYGITSTSRWWRMRAVNCGSAQSCECNFRAFSFVLTPTCSPFFRRCCFGCKLELAVLFPHDTHALGWRTLAERFPRETHTHTLRAPSGVKSTRHPFRCGFPICVLAASTLVCACP